MTPTGAEKRPGAGQPGTPLYRKKFMKLKIDRNLSLVAEGFAISLLFTILCAFVGAVLVDQVKQIPREEHKGVRPTQLTK